MNNLREVYGVLNAVAYKTGASYLNSNLNLFDWFCGLRFYDEKPQDLSFLEHLSVTQESALISLFNRETGFPDLALCSQRIVKHAKDTLEKIKESTGIQILFSGYSNKCSVANGLALPGTDLDAWVIIVNSKDKKQTTLDSLLNNLDPTILSLYHPFSYPVIISLDELQEAAELADSIYKGDAKFNEKEEQFIGELQTEWSNYNLELAKRLKKPNKEPLLHAITAIEVLRDGKVLIEGSDTRIGDIRKTDFYRLSNLLHLRHEVDFLKPKLKARQNIVVQYPLMTRLEKVRLITSLIRFMFNQQPRRGQQFSELYHNEVVNDSRAGEAMKWFL